MSVPVTLAIGDDSRLLDVLRPSKDAHVEPGTESDNVLNAAYLSGIRVEVDGECGWVVCGRRVRYVGNLRNTAVECIVYTLSPPIGDDPHRWERRRCRREQTSA